MVCEIRGECFSVFFIFDFFFFLVVYGFWD